MESKPPLPPFSLEGALKKVRMAEDAWNSRDPDKVVLVYRRYTMEKSRKWTNRGS